MNSKKISFPLSLVLFTALFLGTTCSVLADGLELQLNRTPIISTDSLRARLVAPAPLPALSPVTPLPSTYVIPKVLRVQVGQQGDCASSDAWVAAQILTSLAWRESGLFDYVASPTSLFRDVGNRDCADGWNVDDAMLATTQEHLRMDSANDPHAWGQRRPLVKAGRAGALESKYQMRRFLASDIPLAASFVAFPGINHYKGGIYSEKHAGVSRNHLPAAPAGRHTVMVIGYHTGGLLQVDDFFQRLLGYTPQYATETLDVPAFWVYQNSWGTDWGFHGYGMIAVGEPFAGPIDSKMWWITDVVMK